MARVIAICGGLLGRKGENVEEVPVFNGLLKGQGRPEDAREATKRSGPWRLATAQ